MIRSRNNFFRTSDDAVIYYEEYGQGRPIVLLHGYMCSSKFFYRNIEGLSRNNRLILVDFRGHGSSSKILSGHSIRRYAMDIKELLDVLEVQDALLAGWSLGASVVLQYHLLYGDTHIRGLGLIDPTLTPCDDGPWNMHILNGYNMDKANDVMTGAYCDYVKYCREFAGRMLFFDKHSEELEWMMCEHMKTPPWIAFSIWTEFAHTDGREMLRQIYLPVVLFGADSMVNTKGRECASVHYASDIPKGVYREIYLHDIGGHLLFLKDSELFNERVLVFEGHLQ